MRSFSLNTTAEEFDDALIKIRAMNPSLIFCFIGPQLLASQAFLDRFTVAIQDLPILGCSTAGEICGPKLFQNSISFLVLHFERTLVRFAITSMDLSSDGFVAGNAIARELAAPKLAAVLFFAPGYEVNASNIIDGMRSSLGRNVHIAGALAGDGTNFKSTYTVFNSRVEHRDVVAVGLYGDDIKISSGSEGGWRPFGPARRVTRAEGNVLFELDNKPALQLYKHYLGDKARQLPASGLSYPFAVLRSDRTTSGIIRSALSINHEQESIILAGDVDTGCQVCLMHADTAALTQGAAQAAAEALRTHPGPEEDGCALVVSCVGRRVVLGIDVEDELEAVVDSFLPGIPVAGLYAYGEICTVSGSGNTVLHNQTMTISYITEAKGD